MKVFINKSIFFLGGVLMASSIPEYFEQNLSNGAKVVVIPLNNGTDVISTDIYYRVGSRNEKMGSSGMAHMLEHLNFKSTKNLKTGEFDKIVKNFGGVNNASTSFDMTHYFIKSSSENLNKSLELFSELLQNLKLEDNEFQPERNVVLEERLWRTDNSPFGLIYFTMYNTAFVHHSYHWTPIGFIDDIKNWKIEEIRDFHSKYYSPENSTIVIAGDIQPEIAFKSVKETFGKIQAKNININANEKIIVEPEQFGERRAIIEKDSEVEYFTVGFKIPNYLHEDQFVLSMISEILSGSKSSRLEKRLVLKKEVATYISAYNLEHIDENLFMIMGIAKDGIKADELEKEIWIELEKLKNEPIEERELQKTLISVKSQFIYGFETSSSTASIFGRYLAMGSLEPLLTFQDKIQNIKSEDISRVAKKYFVKNKSSVVIYRDNK
jgi:predicted Zn-dependent peptidase